MTEATDIHRFGVYLVALDPKNGSENAAAKPCLVVSPDEINRHARTVIVAPMPAVSRAYPTRVPIGLGGKQGQIALDQIRTIDKSQIVSKLGKISDRAAQAVAEVLVEMFVVE
jgi:mRNA interferase MazF